MALVLVKVTHREGFDGFGAAQRFWPDGLTKAEVSEDLLPSLEAGSRAGPLSVLAIGEKAVEAAEAAQQQLDEAIANAAELARLARERKPLPGQPGSPAQMSSAERAELEKLRAEKADREASKPAGDQSKVAPQAEEKLAADHQKHGHQPKR